MKANGSFRAWIAIVACVLPLGGCDWFVSAQTRIARANQMVVAADDRGALIELQNALRSEPGNVQARLLLAEISLRLGDPKAAEKELQQATQHGATSAQTGALAAEIHLALREFKQLLALIDSAKLDLQEPSRSAYRGLALMGTNDVAKAVDAFTQALSADANYARARIGLAEALAVQGKSEAGLEQLQTVLTANASDATAALLKGTLLARRGDYAAAATALKSAREHRAGQLSSSQYTMALAALTEAQLALGDLQQARTAHAELVERAPTAPVTRLLAARLAMTQQDYATAVAETQKLVAAAPEMVSAKILLGAALLAQGNLNQAETQLSEVVQLAPENLEARKLLAQANLQLQRPDVAMEVLLPAQQSETADPQLDALLGWANLQRGNDVAAIALLERSVAAQPGNANLKLDLAVAYASAGQHDKAVELLRSLPPAPGNLRRDTLLVNSVAATKGLAAARAEIDRIVAAAPQDVATLNLAGSFYARQGQFPRARELLTRALAKEPGNVSTLMNKARVEMAAGDQKAAASAIDKTLAADPANMTARMMQAEIAARAGDLSGASKRLEEIRAADAAATEPRLLLARLHLQQKKTREADEVIRELHARAQNDAPLASAVGRFYLDASRFEEALGWFRIAAQKDPVNSAYALNVARTQLALGSNSAARETLEAILVAHPVSIPAGAALAMLDLREARREAAVARVAELKKAHPDDSTVAMLEGDIAMASKSYKEAAQAYATAWKLAPSGASAVRAYRANQLGGLPDATAPLETWLQQQPEDVAARMVLAEAHAATGQRDRAIEQYEKVVAADRPNPMALNNLAWLYHEKGDERAAATAQRAYAAAPQVAAVADTYGWILVKKGDVKQGLPILQKAVADSKSQPDIRYHYAVALAQAGKREEARRELAALTRGDAGFAGAEEARKLLAELGD